MALLDWTRMGSSYCLVGIIIQQGQYRMVRPLLARLRDAPVRNVGWSPFLVDHCRRWQLVELVDPAPASAQPPHLEDLWVRELRPRDEILSGPDRRAVLEATLVPPGERAFGAELYRMRTAAYVKPGTGTRSLVSLIIHRRGLRFSIAHRSGRAEPDVRVTFLETALEGLTLAVKDHFLLRGAEQASADLEGRQSWMAGKIQTMGEQIVVRLGLSRPFPTQQEKGDKFCWLMADGFFSLTDPQP